MKGILLAGGNGTRLYPSTQVMSKQLLPIYDKPMIYYPLSTLMLAGITDIMIITTPNDIDRFHALLGDGSRIGISVSYRAQASPGGIPEAFIIAEDFIGTERVCLILGDNIFYGDGLPDKLQGAARDENGSTVFAYYVRDPQRYGIIEFESMSTILSIEEKPRSPRSNWAITGLYYFDSGVVEIAKSLQPSSRGELEITDVIRRYFTEGRLHLQLFGRGYAWLDTGTHDSMLDASYFIKTIEERQGLKVACIEEVAYNMGYISRDHIIRIAESIKTSEYGRYLYSILSEEGKGARIT